jgi:hypothetical protein
VIATYGPALVNALQCLMPSSALSVSNYPGPPFSPVVILLPNRPGSMARFVFLGYPGVYFNETCNAVL